MLGYFTQTLLAPSEEADTPQDDSSSSQEGKPVTPVPTKVLDDNVR